MISWSLEAGGPSFVGGWRVVGEGGELDFASVDGFRERGRGMLGTGRLGCFEALESFGDVARHG